VTQYQYHDRDDFAVEVELLNESELRGLLSELVHDYYHYHQHSAEMESDDVNHWEKQAKAAEDTFQAMFRGRFAPVVFQSGQSEEVILETMLDWTRECSPVNINAHEVVASLEDCAALLKRLTTEESSPRGPAFWPYIKKIRFVVQGSLSFKSLTAAAYHSTRISLVKGSF
jgi:hypothetical protein